MPPHICSVASSMYASASENVCSRVSSIFHASASDNMCSVASSMRASASETTCSVASHFLFVIFCPKCLIILISFQQFHFGDVPSDSRASWAASLFLRFQARVISSSWSSYRFPQFSSSSRASFTSSCIKCVQSQIQMSTVASVACATSCERSWPTQPTPLLVQCAKATTAWSTERRYRQKHGPTRPNRRQPDLIWWRSLHGIVRFASCGLILCGS